MTEVNITWRAEDVQTLKEDWTLLECRDWLNVNGKYIVDRSIEIGWEVIEELTNG
jgi:hypothetical protein